MSNWFYAGKCKITFDSELYCRSKLEYYINSLLSAGHSMKGLKEYYAREIEEGMIRIERRKK